MRGWDGIFAVGVVDMLVVMVIVVAFSMAGESRGQAQ